MSSDQGQGKDDDIEISYDSEVKRKKSRKIKSPPKVEQQQQQQQQHEESDAYSDDLSNDPPPISVDKQRKLIRQQKQQQQQRYQQQQMQFFQPQTMYSCPMPMSPYQVQGQGGPYSPAIYYPQQPHHHQQQPCCRFCNNGRACPPPPIQIPVPVPMPLPPTKNIIRIIKESDGGRRRRCYNDSERSLLNHQSCCSPPHPQRFYHISNNAGTSRAEYCSFPHTDRDRDYCSVVDSTEFCPVPQPTKSNKVKECCIIPKNDDSRDLLQQCCPPSPPTNCSKYPKCFISQAPNCCFNPTSQQEDQKKMITDQGSQCSPPTTRCEGSTQYSPPPKYRECECQCDENHEIKAICCPTKSKYRNKNQQQQCCTKQVVITTNTCECQTDQNPDLMCCTVDPCRVEVEKDLCCKQMLDDFCNRCCSTNTDEEECPEEGDEDCPPVCEPVQTQTDNEWPPPKVRKACNKNCTVDNNAKYPIQPILKKMLECHDTVKVDTMNVEVCNTKAPPAAYYGEPYGFRAINTNTGELVRKQDGKEPERPSAQKHWSTDPKCLAQPERPVSSHSSEPPLEKSPSQSPPASPPPEPRTSQTIQVKTTSSITTLSGTPSKGIEVQTQTQTEVQVGSEVEFHKRVPSQPIQIKTDSGSIKSNSSGNYVLTPPPRTSSLVPPPEPRKSSSIAVKTDSNTVVKSGSSVVKTSSHTSAVSNHSSSVQTDPEPPRVTSSTPPEPTHSSYTIPIAEIPPEGGTFEVRVSSSGVDGGVPVVTIVPSGEMKKTSQISQPSIPVSPECQPLPECEPLPICPPLPECPPVQQAPIQAPIQVVSQEAPKQIQVQVPGCAEPITYTRTDCIDAQPSQSFVVDEPSPPSSPPRKESSEEIIQKSTSSVGTDPEPEAKPERLSMYKIRHTDCDKRVQTTYQPNCENDRYGRGIYPTISPIRFCCDEEVPRFGQPCHNAKKKRRSHNPNPISTNSGTIDSTSGHSHDKGNRHEVTNDFDDEECYDAAGNKKPRKLLPNPQPLLDGRPAVTVTSTHSTYVNASSSSGVGVGVGSSSHARVVGGSSGSGIGGSSSGVGRSSSSVHNTQSYESVVSPRLRKLSQPRNPVQLNSANKDPQCPPSYNIFPNSTHAGIITRPYSRPFKAGLASLNGVDKCFEFK